MKIVQILFLFFLTVPFIEIYLLLQIGGIIGVFPTIFMVVFTAMLGAWLLRKQGLATWLRFQESINKGIVPAYEMIEGPILLVGGALLLTPGFFTDAIGFACLVPGLRKKIARYVIENKLVTPTGFQQDGTPSHHVIEGEYEKKDGDKTP
ncbi:FxsA family protein [methane-oxidizing endosymbiont of Gigantopelta aegis]|uniref:FxsA family protein n=1 Tax=methane-oxidizing endosymbiont of Gigantopelta aegis TaxID=2794938 RepID=UPI0018DC3DCE|nr:FxsA family protein [methane-oxidizing endosymbiont of Gigantopelta aegis]